MTKSAAFFQTQRAQACCCEGLCYPPIDSPLAHIYHKQTQRPVLQDISAAVPAGRLTVVVGEVGSGKSSLLAALLGGEPFLFLPHKQGLLELHLTGGRTLIGHSPVHITQHHLPARRA